MLELARARFGIRAFRPGQLLAIRNVMAGRDTLAIMPTGAGKSLCYQLPALALDGVTLVVSPLIALMKDQHDKLAQLGIDVLRFDSTLTARDEANALRRLAIGGSCVAYVTPERLMDPRFREQIGRVRVALFVVDEAHCISQWGHDFRPAYLGLGEAVRAIGRPPVLALTATAPPKVKDDVLAQLGIATATVIDIGLSRPNLSYQVLRASTERKKRAMLLRLLREEPGCGIIYAATVKAVDALAEYLRGEGISCGAYHGRMRAKDRERVQSSFMAHGEPRIMVATNAFGLGVDKQDLRFVIHYNFPGSLESYYQEAGRAGRDGQPARCVLLYQPEDKRIQSFFLGGRYPTPEQTAAVAQALSSLALAAVGGDPRRLPHRDDRDLPGARLGRDIDDEPEGLELDTADDVVAGETAAALHDDAADASDDTRELPPVIAAADPRAFIDARTIAVKADAPAKKAHVVLQFLKELGFAVERAGGRYAPTSASPPTVSDLGRSGQRYEQKRAQDRARLASMLQYAQSHICRVRLVVNYFGYADGPGPDGSANCGTCDNCVTAAKANDASGGGVARAAQMAAMVSRRMATDPETQAALAAEALRRTRPVRGRPLTIERAKRGVHTVGGLSKGDLVRHATWGEGEVVRVVGDSLCAFFPGHGEKLLKASFLQKIG